MFVRVIIIMKTLPFLFHGRVDLLHAINNIEYSKQFNEVHVLLSVFLDK